MKFVCNNCGFSAEVPDQMSVCPMCASQNVSFGEEKDEDKSGQKKRKEKDTGNFSEKEVSSSPQSPDESKKDVDSSKKTDKKAKITLSDQFFDSKPEKEQEELANIIKELYPEETSKNEGGTFLKPVIIIGVAVGIIIIIVGVVLATVFTDNKEIKDENKPEKMPEKVVAASVIDEESEEIVDDIEIAENIENEERKVVEEEPESPKKAAPEKRAPQKRKSRVRSSAPVRSKPVVKTPPKKVVKKEPVKKVKKPAPPKPSPTELFNKYLQEGHQAVSERKFNNALNKYRSAAKIRPSTGSVYKFIGITYAHMQNQKEACANYRKYIQLAPNAADRAQVEALIEACP